MTDLQTQADAKTFPAITILGLPVHRVDMQEALDIVERFVQERRPRHIITADASMLVMAQEDRELRSILLAADLITPDSAGVLWAARRQGTPLAERVSGVELVERFCALSAQKGYRLYFLGAAPGIAVAAAERMRRRYPGVQIVGAHHGFFGSAENEAILEEIRHCQPDILCVALGIPKQEKWIATYQRALGVPVAIGVGGTFDVLSGKVRRAPQWMRRLHLEWLWRLLNNPRKLGKVLLLPRFVRLVWCSQRTQRPLKTG